MKYNNSDVANQNGTLYPLRDQGKFVRACSCGSNAPTTSSKLQELTKWHRDKNFACIHACVKGAAGAGWPGRGPRRLRRACVLSGYSVRSNWH